MDGDLGYPEERQTITNINFAAQEEQYSRTLGALRGDNLHLKSLVDRLQIELNNLQIITGVRPPQAIEGSDLIQEELPGWISSSDIMSPLLVSYDARIKELEEKLEQQVENLNVFNNQNDELQLENETLRKDLKHYMDKLISITSDEGKIKGLSRNSHLKSSIVGVEEALDLQKQLDLLMEENKILSQQVITLENLTDQLRNEGSQRDEHINTMTNELRTASDTLFQFQKENTLLEEEKRRAENNARGLNSELHILQHSFDEKSSALETIRHTLELSDGRIKHLETNLRELEKAAEIEQEELSRHAQAASARTREVQKQNSILSAELDKLKNSYRELMREFESTRSDASGMLKVMHGMEAQITEFANKESASLEMQKQSIEKVEQALLERDQCLARESQSRKEIARLLDLRKVEETSITYKVNEAVQEVKARLQKQITNLENELSEVTTKLASLQSDLERAHREKKTSDIENEKIKIMVEREKDNNNAIIDKLTARIENSERERDIALSNEGMMSRNLKEYKSNHDSEMEQNIKRIKILEKTNNELMSEIDIKQNEFDKLSSSLSSREGELSRLRMQFNEFRNQEESELETAQQSMKSYKHTYKNHVADLERTIVDLKRDLNELSERSERDLSKLHAENEFHKQALLNTRTEMKDEKNRLVARNEELGARLASLLTEHAEDTMEFGKLQESYDALSRDFEDLREEHLSSSASLSSSLARESEHVLACKHLQLQSDRFALEVDRLKKQRDTMQRQLFECEQKLTSASFPTPYYDYNYTSSSNNKDPLNEISNLKGSLKSKIEGVESDSSFNEEKNLYKKKVGNREKSEKRKNEEGKDANIE